MMSWKDLSKGDCQIHVLMRLYKFGSNRVLGGQQNQNEGALSGDGKTTQDLQLGSLDILHICIKR